MKTRAVFLMAMFVVSAMFVTAAVSREFFNELFSGLVAAGAILTVIALVDLYFSDRWSLEVLVLGVVFMMVTPVLVEGFFPPAPAEPITLAYPDVELPSHCVPPPEVSPEQNTAASTTVQT